MWTAHDTFMAKDQVRNLVASRTQPRDRYKPDSTHGTLLDLSVRLTGIAENYGAASDSIVGVVCLKWGEYWCSTRECSSFYE